MAMPGHSLVSDERHSRITQSSLPTSKKEFGSVEFVGRVDWFGTSAWLPSLNAEQKDARLDNALDNSPGSWFRFIQNPAERILISEG
jgi:hypothetical protein